MHLYERLPLYGTGLVLGVWLVALHALMLAKPEPVQRFLKKFPRDQAMGQVLLFIGMVWFWLLVRYPASSIASFSFWTPLFGVISGALILGDRVTGYLGAAVVLVAAGIYLVNRES